MRARSCAWLALACGGCVFESRDLDEPIEQVEPSNLDGIVDLQGVTGGLDLRVGAYVLDTAGPTLAVAAGGALLDLGGGRFIERDRHVVLALDHLTVAKGATIRVVGDRALIVLVRGDAVIGGRIDAAGGCADGAVWCAGPGGGAGGHPDPSTVALVPASGCGPGGGGVGGEGHEEAGAGGGGHGGAGGSGGNSADTAGGAGGAMCGGERLEPLVGGSGGGGAGYAVTTTGDQRTPGGGGGGALQITSLALIGVAGTLNAGGAGGAGTIGSADSGGGGGGAGGAILLEAPAIRLGTDARVAANGGGGGAGANADPMNDGSPGLLSRSRAPGGFNLDGSSGGWGGVGDGAGEVATAGSSRADGASGGGGGAGRVRFNAVAFELDPRSVVTPVETRGPLVRAPSK